MEGDGYRGLLVPAADVRKAGTAPASWPSPPHHPITPSPFHPRASLAPQRAVLAQLVTGVAQLVAAALALPLGGAKVVVATIVAAEPAVAATAHLTDVAPGHDIPRRLRPPKGERRHRPRRRGSASPPAASRPMTPAIDSRDRQPLARLAVGVLGCWLLAYLGQRPPHSSTFDSRLTTSASTILPALRHAPSGSPVCRTPRCRRRGCRRPGRTSCGCPCSGGGSVCAAVYGDGGRQRAAVP